VPTLLHADGFEHRSISVNDFGAAGSVGIFDTLTNGVQITADIAVFRTGLASLKIAANAASTNAVRVISFGTPAVGVQSIYIWLDSLPSGDPDLLQFTPAAGSAAVLRFNSTSQKFALSWATGGAMTDVGPVLTAGTWYLVDVKADFGVNPRTLACRIDGGTEVAISLAATASSVASWLLGTQGAETFTANYDDWVYSTTAADYPIGAHKVLAIRPNADGTHVPGTNDIERQDGVDIGVATAWDLLDDWPAETTTYVRQILDTGGGADYFEVEFEDTAETTIWDVFGFAALRSAATTANAGGTTKMRRLDGTEVNIYSGDMSETSTHYRSAKLTRPTGDWTQAEVNALKMRGGFMTDGNPDGWWLALMYQYAVPEVIASAVEKPLAVVLSQAVHRASRW
jgi:hypothetical protein